MNFTAMVSMEKMCFNKTNFVESSFWKSMWGSVTDVIKH